MPKSTSETEINETRSWRNWTIAGFASVYYGSRGGHECWNPRVIVIPPDNSRPSKAIHLHGFRDVVLCQDDDDNIARHQRGSNKLKVSYHRYWADKRSDRRQKRLLS
jgi:hypothetical protein